MKSNDLVGFDQPVEFTAAPGVALKVSGVYILRKKSGQSFPRLQGETDIYYIGSTANLKRRFYQYNHPGPTQYTNKRVNGFVIGRKYESEFLWRKEKDEEAARVAEHELLMKFKSDHDEFPPLNFADVRALKQTLPSEKLVLKGSLEIEEF